MSRRRIPTTSPTQHSAVVGWDPPLNTFFAIVETHPGLGVPSEDRIVLWLGDREPISTPKALAEGLKPYATIDEITLVRLAADRAINDGMAANSTADHLAGLAISAKGTLSEAYEHLMAQTPAPRTPPHPTLAAFSERLREALKGA
jgi:hypothetical protein